MGGVVALLAPWFAAIVALRGLEAVTRSSLYRSAYELFYTPLPPAKKRATKTIIDVGGNRAGTQTGYTAYGFSGQVRVLIEGINTTEGTDGAGFYFDYASLKRRSWARAARAPRCRTPACRASSSPSPVATSSRASTTSTGTTTLQGSHIPQEVIDRGVREGSNEIQGYYDTAIQFGGPIKKDKAWFFATYRAQQNRVEPGSKIGWQSPKRQLQSRYLLVHRIFLRKVTSFKHYTEIGPDGCMNNP